jgi:RNA polymerase sigma-70 factor (ECF subfamily)
MERKDRPSQSLDLEELVAEHSDYLFRYARRYCDQRELAEDIVQDALLAAVKGFPSFKGNSSVRTWLTSILRHKIIDYLRSKPRREIPISQEVKWADDKMSDIFGTLSTNFAEYPDHFLMNRAPGAWNESPESILSQKDFFKSFQSCVSKLPDRLRDIFLLREVEEIDAGEIAAQLGISVGNVRVILHRARVLLRDCVDQTCFKSFGSA